MIQYLKHNKIDLKKWDTLISEHGMVYAHSWYLDVVNPKWEALVLDDYEAVMPLTCGRKFGINYLYQPFFVQQLGVFSKQPLSSEMQAQFLNAIPKKFRYCEIKLNESSTFDDTVQGIEYHRNIVLDLSRDYETNRANYHTNTKRNLAKAENNNIEISYGYRLTDVIKLFRANRGAKVEVWGDAEYAMLERLRQILAPHNQFFIVSIRPMDENKLLCGGLYVMNDNRVTFLFSGCGEEGRRLNAMTLMMDEVIKDFSGKPYILDFEGSDDNNLARFYLGFGGKEKPYPSYTFNRLSFFGKAILNVWKRLRLK